MIKFLKINILLILFVFLAISEVFPKSIDERIKFAEYLAETNRPSHALIEYERLLYYEDECTNSIKIFNSALSLYQRQLLLDTNSLKHMIKSIRLVCDDTVQEVDFLAIQAKTISGDIDLNQTYSLSETLHTDQIRETIRTRVQYLYENNLINPENIPETKYYNQAKRLEDSFKRYSPAKAKFLEAIIPGAGHFYLQNYNDALTSFFFKSVLVGSTIFFMQDGNYFAGAGTGLAGGVFYLGSVYSAGRNAQELNNLYADSFASSFVSGLSEDEYRFVLPLFNIQLEF